MNKKILIASLFATLMLLVPMTSAVGVSDVEEDCGCQDVNRYDLLRVKLLMGKLKVITNILLLRFGHIPEIQEKCQEILDVINSNRQLDNSIICDILEPIWNLLKYIGEIGNDLLSRYEDNPIIFGILIFLALPLEYIGFILHFLGNAFDCEWAPMPP